MKESSRKALKMTASILLAVCVLSCSFSVFAVDPTPSPTPALDDGLGEVTDELLARYIWMCLNAWGIHVEYNNIDGYLDAMESQIITWVLQYLAGLPSAYSINQWIAPWQAEFDYWGNLRLNSSALEDIQDFANWLGLTYDLVDDSEYPVNVTYGIGEYSLYKLNSQYLCEVINPQNWPESDRAYTLMAFVADGTTLNGDVYYFVQHDPTITSGLDQYKFVFISTQSNGSAPFGIDVRALSYDINGQEIGGTYESYRLKLYGNNKTGIYYRNIYGSLQDTYNGQPYFILPANAVMFNGTDSEVYQFLQNAVISSQGLMIQTGDIILPDEDESYTIGDSITIIGDDPEYSVIEWDGNVTVGNLPAVIQPSKVDNPEIDQFYDFIPSFIEEAGDSMNFFKQIIFRMPDEVLYCIYAVLASGVIFGFLRILREH